MTLNLVLQRLGALENLVYAIDSETLDNVSLSTLNNDNLKLAMLALVESITNAIKLIDKNCNVDGVS